MDWLADIIGLPSAFKSDGSGGGVIQGTASEAAVVAILGAKSRAWGKHIVRTPLKHTHFAFTRAH